jgi:hypothetical protein
LKDIRESIERNRPEMMEIRNREGAPVLEERSEEHVANIKAELKANEICLKTNKTINEERAARELGATAKVHRLIQISTVNLDIYSKHTSDQTKLDSLGYAIQNTKEELRILINMKTELIVQ